MPRLYDQIAEIRRRVQSYVWTLNDLQELLEDPRHGGRHNIDWAVSDARYIKSRQAAIVEDLSTLLPLLLRLSEHHHDIDLAWAPADGEAVADVPADRDTVAVLDLGCRLLRHLAAASGANVLISPIGIMLGLGMLANGARGETARAAVATLGMSVERINALAARVVAAAATTFHTGGRGPASFLMTVDRPFCIVIRDEQSGLPLFAGAISEPATLDRA